MQYLRTDKVLKDKLKRPRVGLMELPKAAERVQFAKALPFKDYSDKEPLLKTILIKTPC